MEVVGIGGRILQNIVELAKVVVGFEICHALDSFDTG